MSVIWSRRALVGGSFRDATRIESDAAGRITRLDVGAPAEGARVVLGTVVPGFGNTHSHLFHRALRGRTHGYRSSFWTWREQMYKVAGSLNPDRYRLLAMAVFAEMLAAGYTAVGEFHYVHHRPNGRPYPNHEMELALADAAEEVGIRLTLLDTCYLTGGLNRPLEATQRRFGDGTAAAWLDRWHRLRDRLGVRPLVTLGAAVHSVRAVPETAIAAIVAGLPPDTSLHAHVSEQPRENEECLAYTGTTPTGVFARSGALGPRFTAVHATHLTWDDVALLGSARASIALCPTTEADLADGIAPARRLVDSGARVAIGSDQNAVVDPLLELRAVESHERLTAGLRGVFDPAELWLIGTASGYTALGLREPTAAPGLAVGDPCDLVELDDASIRTIGGYPEQLPLVATAADVLTTVVGGRVIRLPDVPALLADAIRSVGGR